MHRTVIEAGPGTIRRLCCGSAETGDADAAVRWLDDPVALVDGEPVAVPELLRSVLTALACPGADGAVLIHPTWWSARRVDLVAAAARDVTGDAVTRPRATVLAAAAPDAGAIIEIGPALVAVTTAGTVAEPRLGAPEEVADRVAALVTDVRETVVIDGLATVGGAPALARLIAERLRGTGADVLVVDDAQVTRLATRPPPTAPKPDRTRRRPRLPLAGAAVAAVVAAGTLALGTHREPPVVAATTVLLEGRVAVQVPAQWTVRRVTDGPGSARVEVVSPADPQAVLHVTQSASGGTLAVAADLLRRALDAAPPGVFADFDPSATSAGRPAVTYREIRVAHRVAWTVLVDGPVRIGIGCQSGSSGSRVRGLV
ncbi:type VII secretion-associated protein, partial [Mycolicibacter acidiphilus]